MSITKSEWYRDSDGEKLFTRSWTGDSPKAVLLIAHGMAEHSARYDEPAAWLAERGLAVFMHDHRGHGQTGGTPGYFGEGPESWHALAGDMASLREDAAARYPGLPVFLLGHSMGSFVARDLIGSDRKAPLAGVILSGTMGENPALATAIALAKLQSRVLGPRSTGRLLSRLSSMGYLKEIESPVNQFAWLSRDEEVCRRYEADPLCGFPFTAAGYWGMFEGIRGITGRAWADRVPKELPVFLLAGDKDPVGSCGQGPRQTADWLRDAGVKNVTLKLYPGMRHECLNELGREQVFEDVLRWIEARLPGSSSAEESGT